MTTKRNAPSSPDRSNSSDSEESVEIEDDDLDSESIYSESSFDSVMSVRSSIANFWKCLIEGDILFEFDAPDFRSLLDRHEVLHRYPKSEFRKGLDSIIKHDGDRSVIRQLFSDWGYPSHWWVEEKMYDLDWISFSKGDEGRIVRFCVPWKTKSLPPYIDRLQNLQRLDLFRSKILRNLPKEIGNLSNLIRLNLSESAIESLPPSIGKLQNLEILRLWYTRQLTSLPEEIGNLGSLTGLFLARSGIRSLPPSIGRLQSLEELDLRKTKQLTSLPKEIGNLGGLILLKLEGSGVTKLPPSIEYALACSRCKYRASVAMAPNHFTAMGWPILFENASQATRVFRPYDEITQDKNDEESFGDPEDCFGDPDLVTRTVQPDERLGGLEPHDAIYRFLTDYGESFVKVIIDRNNQKN